MKRVVFGSILGLVMGLAVVNVVSTHAQPATQPGKPHDHQAAKFDLGTLKIGGFDVQVGQVAEAKAGEETIFIITVKGTGKPRSIRAWIGVESGQGSIRTSAEEEKPNEWHAHHQVSRPMPANSKLWIELEVASGRPKASFTFRQ
jgi:hypothetical protein